ncbi:histidine kinase dimerization/phospho-acceptor domain-containing protein [Nocardioides sp. LS1]|uniref:histidine kinase dimerization/phospho-acceptor domain-containing protein n=1 Tax=Nocardioides sp. LS1 TaxID=1027620 RepID=UPI000F621D70|nr:histidine kinase dimerization/phospho-acceptor domain-containing protein [Nocardioides sp. LS1]GCD90990.1 two-component sensor histidine kinase [Nocardioides sp. LS1]
MRNRLTLAFIVLSVCLLLGAGILRSFILRDLIREQESAHVHEESVLIADIVDRRQAEGGKVDETFLRGLVGADDRLVYSPHGAPAVEVHGSTYDDTNDPAKDIASSSEVSGGDVTVSQSPEVIKDILYRDISSVLALFLLIGGVAGLCGFFFSRWLSAPFRQLATAAAALGRGRFDLDLPETKIPEARAISLALGTSATQLEDRLRRERDFAEHTSHVLRTPLTGLRLEMEELALREDVPADVRQTAVRSMKTVDGMNQVAGDLVELARSGSLVAGAELPLVDLATQLAQRWADRLAARDRALTASAEGDLELTYTPGPVEHVLDLVLAEVVRRGTGGVRIIFSGQEGGHLRVRVASEGVVPRPRNGESELSSRLDEARTVVAALGGRISGDDPAQGLEVLLPRR